jgi:manganese/zinc/iron transport system substrate-binding protein
VLITGHDAFSYFGQRFNIVVEGIQGISTVTEASPAEIRRLADLIASRKIKAIFTESSLSPSTIEALQKAVQSKGWNVKIGGTLYSDSMGEPGSPTGTYQGMLEHNVRTIVNGLK